MTERLRCSECTGHIAYECDKSFTEMGALILFDEVMEALPAREFEVAEGSLKMTEHAPGTSYAVDRALERRSGHIQDFISRHQEEFECELAPEDYMFAVYEAVEEMREERPEQIADAQRHMGEGLRKFLNMDNEEGRD